RDGLTHAAFLSFGEDKLSLMNERLVRAVRRSREQNSLTDHLALEGPRAVLGARMNAFHGAGELLLPPTVAVAPFDAGLTHPPGYPDSLEWYPFTAPFNFTRQPAASVPCGFTRSGLPVGLQIVGPSHADLLVLQAAHAFERARP